MSDFGPAIKILNQTYPFWTTRVLNIGRPVLDSAIPTACIAWDKTTGDFTFRFNPDFANGLDDAGKAFIMSHEAMHVVRNDMRHMENDYYTDKLTLNKALDCIINDTLRNAGMETLPEACHGDKFGIGDCEGRPVREVYDAMFAPKDDEEPSDGEGEGSGDGGTGKNKEANPHDDHSSWDEDMADAAERHSGSGDDAGSDAVDGTEDGDSEGKPREPGTEEQVSVSEIERLDAVKLFSLMDPDMLDNWGFSYQSRADWRRPRKTLAGMYPKVMLPSRRDDKSKHEMGSKRPQIIIGIDNSGSVSTADKALFLEIVRALPKDYAEYVYVSVATGAVEISKEEVARQLGSTCPQFPAIGSGDGCHVRGCRDAAEWMRTQQAPSYCVEAEAMQEWILESVRSGRLRAYPKAVLFISDMQTWLCHATVQQGSRWLCIYNHAGSKYAAGRDNDLVTARGRRESHKYIRHDIPVEWTGVAYGWDNGACKIPPNNIRHLRSFIRV